MRFKISKKYFQLILLLKKLLNYQMERSTTISLHTELSAKILLVGDSGVGKTSLINRFTEDTFSQRLPSTMRIIFK